MKWKDFDIIRRWRPILKFNKICNKDLINIKYVLLINNTDSFNLIKDLNYLFRKRFCNRYYFINLCKNNKCAVLYYTVFSRSEKRKYGPISDDISKSICNILLRKILKVNSEIILVSNFKIKPFPNQKIITFEMFESEILLP